jgi:predicted metal-binding protein
MTNLDQLRERFEAEFDCTALVYEKHIVSDVMAYRPGNVQESFFWNKANLRNNQFKAYQVAHISAVKQCAEILDDRDAMRLRKFKEKYGADTVQGAILALLPKENSDE